MVINLKLPLLTLLVVAAFIAVWTWLAGYLAPWGDDLFHLSTARGYVLTGEPFFVRDELDGTLLSIQYHRALDVTRWTAWSFQLFGESVFSGRLVPFVFTLGIWLLYVGYTQWRGYADAKQIVIVTVLFFAQAMILEKALAVRMYAPLLFFLLLAMIAIWEAANYTEKKKLHFSVAWIVLAGLAMWMTIGWHIIQFPVFILAILILWITVKRDSPINILHGWWIRFSSLPRSQRFLAGSLLVMTVVGLMAVGPVALDTLGLKVLGANRTHLTVWDNVFGLIRFLIAINILLILWWKAGHVVYLRRDFNSWILITGIISGIVLALTFNVHWVFYTRYLYLSAGLVVLGAAPLLATLPARSYLPAALVVYVLLNIGLSASTFVLNRNDIQSAVNWLDANTSEDDIIFSFRIPLYFIGGVDLSQRTIPIWRSGVLDLSSNEGRGLGYLRRDSRNPYLEKDEVASLLESRPNSDVYFIYTEHFELRTKLYKWTTGRDRGSNDDLYWFLRDRDIGESVVDGLRSGAVMKLDRTKLLTEFEKWDFP